MATTKTTTTKTARKTPVKAAKAVSKAAKTEKAVVTEETQGKAATAVQSAAIAVQDLTPGFTPKTWENGEVVYANDMNRLEQGLDQAYTLAQTNEGDIAALESGATHSMMADTQTPTVPSNLVLSIGLVPVWKAGADVLLRSAIVDVSATAATTITAGTVIATGLNLKASQSYAVWFLSSAGAVTHNTLQTNSTGKSLTLSADETFAQGTTLMMITENDI